MLRTPTGLPGAVPFLAVCLAATLVSPPVLAQEADALARQLIGLRAEVEQLNGELAIAREENRTLLAGLNAQRAEVEATLSRQQLTLKQIQNDLAKRQQAAVEAGVSGDVLTPVLLGSIARLDAQIAAGLPFKREERRAGLAELREQLSTGKLAAPRAANRLWAFLEDEFRLTRDNTMQRQTISLNGERLLVDVAKLGSMMLLFRTDDGRYGAVRRDGGEWRFELAADEADARRIATLFDALRKQIRQGFFELPNVLASGGGQ